MIGVVDPIGSVGASAFAVFWTANRELPMVRGMRRQLRIKVAFEPNRLSEGALHTAYGAVMPIRRRCVRKPDAQPEAPERTAESLKATRTGEER